MVTPVVSLFLSQSMVVNHLRFLVVGCGSIGREFALRHLRPENGATVVGVVDSSAPLAQQLAADVAALAAGGSVAGGRYAERVSAGGTDTSVFTVPAFTSLAEALAACGAQADAVFVGTPPASHLGLTQQALGARLHVLLEKPIAADTADSVAIVHAAAAAAPTAVVGLDIGMRYNAALVEMRARLPRLGRLQGARLRLHFAQWPRPWQRQPWVAGRAQGGALREVGTHFFAAIHELFGRGCVTRVKADVRYPQPAADAADAAELACSATLELRPPSGAPLPFDPFQLVLDVDAACGPSLRHDVYSLSVRGEHGALELYDFCSLRACARDDGGAGDVLVADAPYGRAECVRELVAAARQLQRGGAADERPADLVTPLDALHAQLLLDAILQSGGKWRDVDAAATCGVLS